MNSSSSFYTSNTSRENTCPVHSEDFYKGIVNNRIVNNDSYCKKMFVEIKPDLLVNKMNILWVQKYGECIFLSQNDKIHEVCNTTKKEDVLFNKVNDLFFGK